MNPAAVMNLNGEAAVTISIGTSGSPSARETHAAWLRRRDDGPGSGQRSVVRASASTSVASSTSTSSIRSGPPVSVSSAACGPPT